MPTFIRRLSPLFVLVFLAILAGTPLRAYPVTITINVTFFDVPGEMDPLGLGLDGNITGTITTTLDSVTSSGGSYTYNGARVSVSIPMLNLSGLGESGSVTVNTDGTISAAFSESSQSFSATLVIPGLTLPTPSAYAFGTKNFSSPSSLVSYNLFGSSGTVGVTGTISALGLTASPLTGISATATQNGSAPAPQSISVTSNNPASAAIAYTATVSPSSATWLTLTGGSGSTPGTVTANFNTSLAPGTYTASVLINDAGDTVGPLSIPVTYTVTGTGGGGGSSGLQVSPGTVTFNFFLPTSVSGSQTVSVTSTGAAAAFTASVTGSSAITVTPTSGTTPDTLTIKGNGSALSNGTYNATVTLTTGSGITTIPVIINVTGGSGTGGGASPIGLNPSSLTFNVNPGETNPPSQTVKLTSVSPVSFTVGNVALYLPITPLSGTTPATLTVPIDVANLTPGTHTDYVQILSGNTSAELIVTVNVGSVTLSSTTTSLLYAYPPTSTSPLTQVVTVTQSGSAAAVPLVATPSASWLSATISGDTVTITANPDGQAQGTLTGNVVISSPLGSNSVTIPVTFSLNSAPPGLITVMPTSIAFAYQTNGAIPPSQGITVSAQPLASGITFTAFGASWLSISSGVANGFQITGTLTVNPQGLAPGVYTGSVLVGGTNFVNAPYFVPVTLAVSTSSTFAVSPTTLTFSDQPGGTPPASQTIALSSSVSNFITVSSNVPWISVTPASSTTPATFTVTANPGTMANGSYNGIISFVGGGLTAQTVQVPVALDIAAVSAPILNAVTNAESYLTSPESPGSFVALWGVGLGPTPSVPLQLTNATTVATNAGGTQVFANGIPCPILFTSNQQVNAILPFSLAGQSSAILTVQYQGVMSNALTIPIAPSDPGLFALDGTGQGGGAILNQDLSVNSSTNPAAAGAVVVLFGGGAGQTSPAGSDGLIVPGTAPFPVPALPVTATVAGQPAQILYAGDAPDLVSGVLQVNLVIPAGTPSGPQPVVITVGTASSQPNLDVYVQ
jgi:uncharacterized protein (TIGR03437 family)